MEMRHRYDSAYFTWY